MRKLRHVGEVQRQFPARIDLDARVRVDADTDAAASPNAVVSRTQILSAVWGDASDHTGRSPDVFISRLRKRFPPQSGVEIPNVHGEG
ncbi:MAG: helix-turn-helix domain-containing protein [Bacteroidetes bacterium]|nr:helix-turn-helix domain-containing protein [Bacteroidota bacterium]